MQDETSEDRAFRLRSAAAAHATHRAAVAGQFAPLVALGTEILKAMLLINAGAGAATLALMSATLASRPAMAQALVLPLSGFGFGLVVAGCATGWSYFAHEEQARSLALQTPVLQEPFLVDSEASLAAARGADRYRHLALGAVFVAIASAILGFSAAGAIMLLMIR